VEDGSHDPQVNECASGGDMHLPTPEIDVPSKLGSSIQLQIRSCLVPKKFWILQL